MSANHATRNITLTKVRQLDLSATTPGRPLHLSAASGLACLNSFNYVVADDELHLGVFRTNSSEPGHLVRLFEGELPSCKVDRKKQKPPPGVLNASRNESLEKSAGKDFSQNELLISRSMVRSHPRSPNQSGTSS
ncbi:MAG TPA: hypothetical protein VFN63_01745 [Pseudolabrys sp.]|nr:hypothetical protein [Pseudolabrys sp.]